MDRETEDASTPEPADAEFPPLDDSDPSNEALLVPLRRTWSEVVHQLGLSSTVAEIITQLDRAHPTHDGLHALAELVQAQQDMAAWSVLHPESSKKLFVILETHWVRMLQDRIKNGPLDPTEVMIHVQNGFSLIEREFGAESLEHLMPAAGSWLILKDFASGAGSQTFQDLLMELVGYLRLESLCRYGDYLAERLGTLRQEVQKGPNGQDLPTEHWATKMSDMLKLEEGKVAQPYHERIRRAADSLGWNQKRALFMIHEYAMRNKLMHAELFDVVDRRDWSALAERCEEDITKLRQLFITSNQTSKDVISHWERIIEEFRDRWVYLSEDGSTWKAQPTIQEALNARLEDRASLCKIAMLPSRMSPNERTKFIADRKKGKAKGEKTQGKEKHNADAQLRAENQRLEKEVSDLRDALTVGGTQVETLAKLRAKETICSALEKDKTKYQNQIKRLKRQIGEKDDLLEDCKWRARALPGQLEKHGVSTKTIGDIQKAMKIGEAEARKAREVRKKKNAGKKRSWKETENVAKGVMWCAAVMLGIYICRGILRGFHA